MRTDTPPTIRLADYRPPAYLVDRVDLDVRLARENTRISARLALRPNPSSPDAGGPLVLDGEGLGLRAISLDGVPLTGDRYATDGERLTIPAVPQRPFLLETETAIDPAANKALSGLYLSNGVYCTQCEAEGFRRIAYFPDRPDVLSRYRVRIEARKSEAPHLLSNGNLVAAGELAGSDRHFAVWEDPHAKPCYLFALVAGDLACVEDEFVTSSGRKVKLQIFVEHGKEDRCGWAMESLKRAMKWDEERFGRQYDLDRFMIVAVSDFNMGAMENKGLNIFNDKYVLARPDTATDQDYAHIEGIIAHEYFHNWTGNRITCRDWFQLCLKEGLTVYRDQEFSSDIRSRPVKRISDVKLLRAQQFAEDAGPLAHPVRPQSYIEINNFYTATVYEKGAEVVRMMATLLGAEAFRRAMDLYFARHDGEAATVEDFVTCMEDASGRDLSQFFRWYEEAGTPEITVKSAWHPAEGVLELTLSQSLRPTPGQPVKPPLHIPLALGLVGEEGKDLPLDLEGVGLLNNPVIELTEKEQTFRFRNLRSRPVPSLNRGFSAPVRLVTDLSAADELALMGRDGDPFNRWDMGQTRARDIIVAEVGAPDATALARQAQGYAAALSRLLADESLEEAFKALMLTLPAEQDLAREIASNVDPAAIHQARDGLRRALGGLLRRQLRAIWERQPKAGPYSPDPASAGRRSLAYAALDLLSAADAEEGARLAFERHASAANMTDEMGALNVLARLDSPLREEALAAFFAAHRSDPLLIDKWLSLHAVAPFDGTVGRVRGLMAHELFDIANPNRVRALVGSFAAMNPVQFNARDGSGYELVGEAIATIDAFNPQVAARLATNFRSWRALEPVRRERARLALVRLRDLANVSRDTYEIAAKSLQD
jgi:aminopeptidase N